MNCPNCNYVLKESDKFCTNCGAKISENTKSQPGTSEVENNLKNSTTNVFLKYKKISIFVILLIIFSIIAVILFYNFFGFDKLSWNEKYTDSKLEYVMPTNIKLGIIFDNEEKVKDIKYEVTCGEVKNNGLEIDWNLNNANGKCIITASYKYRKLIKEYTIINYNLTEQDLVLDYNIDLNSNEDLDLDGLTNKEEKEHKTNAVLSDTDMDNLDDKHEILISKTDPKKDDTDDDGLSDYDEIELGLDPLKGDSKGDGVKDGERNLTYNYTSEKLKLSITGNGNIASTIVQVNSNTKISDKVGLIDKLYTFYTYGTIEEAVVTITYTDEELVEKKLNEDNLSIYYYNEKELKYEKVSTTIDKENNTLTAVLKHFSNYVVGDTTLVKESSSTEILFILDNSWSMYTNKQYKEITGKDYNGGLFNDSILDGFDEEGIRFTLTSDLISKLDKKGYQLGISEFRYDYENVLEIGSDVESLKTKLKTMNGNFVTDIEGTNIRNAITKGLDEFSKNIDNKYIVILTDGQDSALSRNAKNLIEKLIKKDVKICSIGFGGGSYNTALSNISNATGCGFYSSGNVEGLTELFENVETKLNDNLVDIDDDNEVDGILLADSGFIVNRDGFSFGNYGTNLSNGGHCYGMATFAELFYKKQLPLTVGSITSKNEKSYAYDLTKTYFDSNNNLYDYKLKSNILKYTFGYETFSETKPSDLKTLEGTKLAFSEKYKTEIVGSGIYDFVETETGLSKEMQLERWGVNYNTVDSIYLNEDKIQTSDVLENEEIQLLNAIYAGFIRQNTVLHYSSGTNFVLWARDKIGTEAIGYSGGQGFINILKSRLNDKDAPVISASYSGGLHAINAISLVQDIENPNYYYIGVYDNNYPGEKRYVDIMCNKEICSTVANDYYTATGEVIRITPSLENDLEYYK